MIRKDSYNHMKKIYSRFWLSFFCVFILPILFITFVFFRFFFLSYKEELVTQMEYTLNSLVLELDGQMEDMWMISAYNFQHDCVQDYQLKRNYEYKELQEMLISEEAKHSEISRIYYYTMGTPEKIYSSSGVNSWDNFAKKYLGVEDEAQLVEQMESSENLGLRVCIRNQDGREIYKKDLYYIVRIARGKYWFFLLSQPNLSKLLSKGYGEVILLDESGEQLYPFEPIADYEENEEKYYRISVKSASGEFELINIVDKDILFQNLRSLQASYWGIVSVVMLLGFLISVILSNYHERPFNELNSYIGYEEEIPTGMDGMSFVKYAIKKIEDDVSTKESGYIINNLLLQLLFGWEKGEEQLKNILKERKLLQKARAYCLFVASMHDNTTVYSERVELYLHSVLDKSYELHRIKLEMQNHEVFLIGLEENATDKLEKVLLETVDFFTSELGIDVSFYMGEACDRIEQISLSYQGIIARLKNNNTMLKEKLVYCKAADNTDNNILYPDIELNTLYEALREDDIEKADIMTDILVGIVKKNNSNSIMQKVLLHDILDTYLKIIRRKSLNMDSYMRGIEAMMASGESDSINVIRNLAEQYKNEIKNRKVKVDREFVYVVMEYIDENREMEDLNVNMVADYFGVSVSNLSHQFKYYENRKISDYITEKKLEYAAELLRDTDYTIADISQMLGYTQASSFGRKFKQSFGMTPIEYRESKKC